MNPFRKIYLQELTGKQKKIDVNHNGKIEGSDLAALRAKKGMKKEETQVQEEAMGKGGKVETKKYSWGTMKTVHHGADFSIPLHPEHHQAISKLKDNQEHKFKDETGKHWTAKRMGDNVHFQGANNGGKTHVPHSTMHEETEIQEAERPGLYANINAKRKRIEAGSGERMRKPGSKGAPSAQDFKDAAKTAKEDFDVKDYLKRLNEAMKKCSECGKTHKGKCSYSEETEQISEAMKKCPECGEKMEKGKCDCCGYSEKNEKMEEAANWKQQAAIAINMKKHGKKPKNMKEEVELTEANHREFASKGMMHPDMAKHMTVGQEHDYYEHGTGDKVSGKVVKKTDTEVHMKQTHDSYDPKKKGTVHKFKIGSSLPEETSMEYTQEELALIEQFIEIAEKMNMSKASMGDVIKDFKKSDAPQFKGKSVEKRRQMAIAAKLSADRMKKEETETTSFKGFLAQLDEIKMSDLPVRKVSGKYGTEYYKQEKEKDEKGYDDEESSSPSEKRGRGRPAGSKSGARQKGSTTGKKRSGVEMTGYPLHLPNSK